MNRLPHKVVGPSVVRVPVDGVELEGELEVPPQAKGLVIFAHGSGSSRLSPRNIAVEKRLRIHSLATLLIDLLTEEEDNDLERRFDIDLLTERLTAITDWALHAEQTEGLDIGYFGASTGAAAALLAAAGGGDVVKAVVSRGGRVDLAERVLETTTVPTMLIVGQNDFGVLAANNEAFLRLGGKKELAVIPHATHLFEEHGALERVAQLAAQWFNEYLDNDGNGTTHNRRERPGD